MAMGQGAWICLAAMWSNFQRRHCQHVFAPVPDLSERNPARVPSDDLLFLHLHGHTMLRDAFPKFRVNVSIVRLAPGAKTKRRGCRSPSGAAGQPSGCWILLYLCSVNYPSQLPSFGVLSSGGLVSPIPCRALNR